MRDVVIIGAGMAGCAAARALRDAGAEALILEKSRGAGGRLATRRAALDDGTPLTFDHGAPVFGAHGAGFAAIVQEAEQAGAAARYALDPSAVAREPGWVGAPAMNAIVKWLAADLRIETGARASDLARTSRGWRIHLEDGAAIDAARVVCAVPAPQASALIAAGEPALAAYIDEAAYAPQWTLMAAFDAPPPAPDAPPRRTLSGASSAPPFSISILNNEKPGRPDAPLCWTLHADAAFSRERLEVDAGTVRADLLAAFRAMTGALAPVYAAAHRWRYARVAKGLGESFLHTDDHSLLCTGDWLGWRAGDADLSHGRDVERAFLSGVSAASAILSR